MIPAQQDIPYHANLPASALDWYPPKHVSLEPTPLVIFVHGGGFAGGDETIDPDASPWAAYRHAGMAVASLRYTLYPAGGFLQNPSMPQDVGRAVQYFRLHHERYGIDKRKIILHGNSAGAIISQYLAYGPDLKNQNGTRIERESTRPRALVNHVGLCYWPHVDTAVTGKYFGQQDLTNVAQDDLLHASGLWWLQQSGPVATPTLGVFGPYAVKVPPVMDPHASWYGKLLDDQLHAVHPQTQSDVYYGAQGANDLWQNSEVLIDWVNDVLS